MSVCMFLCLLKVGFKMMQGIHSLKIQCGGGGGGGGGGI